MLLKNKRFNNKKIIKNTFNQTLLRLFLKGGSKSTAKKNFKLFFLNLSNEINYKEYSIINTLVEKLYIAYELRIIKFRSHTNVVPFPVTRNRRFFLNIKWLLTSVALDNRYIPFYKKLSDEVIKIIKNEESNSKKIRDNIEFSVLNYKTNIHYRWN
jgi:ribosomal protein S7